MQDSSSPSEAPQSFRDTILQKRRLKGCILLVIISWLLGQVLGCNPVFTEQRNTLVAHSQRTEENQRHQKQRDSDRKLLNPMVITSLCLSSFLLQEEGVETTKHGHTGHGPTSTCTGNGMISATLYEKAAVSIVVSSHTAILMCCRRGDSGGVLSNWRRK